MNTGKLISARLLSVLGLLVIGAPVALAQAEDQPLRYARVSVPAASVFNLADANGIELMKAGQGTLLSVWREQAGWLEVESPGGFPGWVHGRYLTRVEQESGEPAPAGVYEVTDNAINIRPLPKSDVTSFPLPQRLETGDRVRVLELAEPDKPIADTWARIVTPPGVHAWVRADQTAALVAGENGPELWTSALAAGPARPAPVARAAEPAKSEAVPSAEGAAREELERIRAAIDAERASDQPEYAALEGELRALLASAPTSALELEVQGELSRLKALAEVAQVRVELERERARREEEVRSREKGVREASRAKDPLGPVYRSRGVLLRSTRGNEPARFHLSFGGKEICEVVCTSGRYDLDLFAGYEVGVFGDEIASTAGASVLDIGRLEIVKRR